MIIIKCQSCGFPLYQGRQLKSVDDVLRYWSYRCPCCLSILDPEVKGFDVRPSAEDRHEAEDQKA